MQISFMRKIRKVEIAAALKKLESIVYHEKIGTLAEKVTRVRKIAGELGKSFLYARRENMGGSSS